MFSLGVLWCCSLSEPAKILASVHWPQVAAQVQASNRWHDGLAHFNPSAVYCIMKATPQVGLPMSITPQHELNLCIAKDG